MEGEPVWGCLIGEFPSRQMKPDAAGQRQDGEITDLLVKAAFFRTQLINKSL